MSLKSLPLSDLSSGLSFDHCACYDILEFSGTMPRDANPRALLLQQPFLCQSNFSLWMKFFPWSRVSDTFTHSTQCVQGLKTRSRVSHIVHCIHLRVVLSLTLVWAHLHTHLCIITLRLHPWLYNFSCRDIYIYTKYSCIICHIIYICITDIIPGVSMHAPNLSDTPKIDQIVSPGVTPITMHTPGYYTNESSHRRGKDTIIRFSALTTPGKRRSRGRWERKEPSTRSETSSASTSVASKRTSSASTSTTRIYSTPE